MADVLSRPTPVLDQFEYLGVRLLPGRFATQVDDARRTYAAIPTDDILKGFREQARLNAPGDDMGGWCSPTSGVIFGQLVSGFARLARALDDAALRAKAIDLVEGWHLTVRDGDLKMNTYEWEKLICGLLDLYSYGEYEPALSILEEATHWAAKTFDQSPSPATILDWDGRGTSGTLEWYTLPENLYRAYLASGRDVFREFAGAWLYTQFWDAFEATPRPTNVSPVHAYSHVNSFNSAAMAYAATGDEYFLRVITNAFEYLQATQCFATGSYGPGERLLPADGRLGLALELQTDSAEVPCGSWAGFKLARYLMMYTGLARYGDWIEALLFNGIGAALPTRGDGQTFYYADYHIPCGAKHYFWDRWPCCAGTYLQAVADYHNLIYFQAEDRLFVNLFIPSEVEWSVSGRRVRVRQTTEYPLQDSTQLTVDVADPTPFTLSIRVPSWTKSFQVAVNDVPVSVDSEPGTWANLDREWTSGDVITVQVALDVRVAPVDEQHPRRVAISYGPLVLVQDARAKRPLRSSSGGDVPKLTRESHTKLVFHAEDFHEGPSDRDLGSFFPLIEVPEGQPYRTYIDLDGPCLY